eukprot:3111520-Rhodomonas_salina.1
MDALLSHFARSGYIPYVAFVREVRGNLHRLRRNKVIAVFQFWCVHLCRGCVHGVPSFFFVVVVAGARGADGKAAAGGQDVFTA